MLTLASDVQTAIAGDNIWPVRLVHMNIGGTNYYISDHYKNLTYSSNTYLPNGNLLGIDGIQNTIEANEDSIEVSLSAIDTTFRQDILNADAIGGEVTIYRGLINKDTGLILGTPIVAFTGFIFSMSMTEEAPDRPQATIEKGSFTAVAEVRSSLYRLSETHGRFTNDASNKEVDSTDDSMEFVASLNGLNVRFGGSD